MARHHIEKDIKRFVRLNLSADRWNTIFGFQVVLLLLLAASWNAGTIHARADIPNEDSIYLRLHYQSLREMEQGFYQKNLGAIRKLRYDRRKGIFLVADETHDPYFGKKRSKWIHEYKPIRGSRGSFTFLTFALVAPKQWRRVIRCVPVSCKQDTIPLLVETAREIRKRIRYDALLLDRGFYEKNIAFSLDEVCIPFIMRAELRGKVLNRFSRISHHQKFPHWQKRGIDPLVLWIGWKKYRGRKHQWGCVTNIRNAPWSCCNHWYSHRWNIENVFKATDGIQLKIATSKIRPRLFAVLLSFCAYNEWQKRNCTARAHLSLTVFVEQVINHELADYLKKGPPFSLHIPGWLFSAPSQGSAKSQLWVRESEERMVTAVGIKCIEAEGMIHGEGKRGNWL